VNVKRKDSTVISTDEKRWSRMKSADVIRMIRHPSIYHQMAIDEHQGSVFQHLDLHTMADPDHVCSHVSSGRKKRLILVCILIPLSRSELKRVDLE
jgi:hypothetical protein